MRTKDVTSLAPEHVEVEGADGTTQIHPLDEPEDQAVAEGQAEGATALALPQAETTAESTGAEPVAPATAPAAPAATTPAAPVHTTGPGCRRRRRLRHRMLRPHRRRRSPHQSYAATPAPTAEAAVPAAGDGQVQLQFTADCWAQVTDGRGKVLFSGLKRKGDSVSVSGKPPLAVRLGVARAAQVSYNGQAVDIAPFTSGETARLKLGQ